MTEMITSNENLFFPWEKSDIFNEGTLCGCLRRVASREQTLFASAPALSHCPVNLHLDLAFLRAEFMPEDGKRLDSHLKSILLMQRVSRQSLS